MDTFDWIVAALPLVFVFGVGLYSRMYVRSVADFMSANRSAGRYLLCIAGGELQAGAVMFVAAFESFNRAGTSESWWYMLTPPIYTIIGITGFIGYRYRQTRAMTLAQFFEIRYNRAFRIFTGCIGYFAGILNFGVIPAVGARVMVYILGLPEEARFFAQPVPAGATVTEAPLTFANYHEALAITLPMFIPLMAIFLCVTLFIAVSGGVITVMMIDTTEGIISQIAYLILMVTVLSLFSWSQMNAAFLTKPPGESMINPFDSFATKDFNLWSVLMGLWLNIYGRGAWQNASGYSSAGLTPHESRMGGILTFWREMGKNACIGFLAMAAFTYLHSPAFAEGARQVHERLAQIADSHTQRQMESAVALSYLLPIGVKGLFCAVLLMGIFGGDATHLHSWGSIFVQDVLLPIRKKRVSTKTHLKLLRASICFVAVFAFVFGISFTLVDFIRMWWAVTMGIFVGGAGAAIIGGLYWKKGTPTGAFAGFAVGSVLSVTGIILQKYWVLVYHQDFYVNGLVISFITSFLAAGTYITVSLLTCREDFNLDRMLHRGAYADVAEKVGEVPMLHRKKKPFWGRIVGFDDNFTRGDKWIAGGILGWQTFWALFVIVVTVWNLCLWHWPTEWWSTFRHYNSIYLPIFFSVVTCIWFTYGGLRDMRRLFRRLKQERVNDLDDGTVVAHENIDERAAETRGQH